MIISIISIKVKCSIKIYDIKQVHDFYWNHFNEISIRNYDFNDVNANGSILEHLVFNIS